MACGIFPEAPVLKTFFARKIRVLGFPDLRAATTIRIESTRDISAALVNATLFKTLIVELRPSEELKGTYPSLRTLELSGNPESDALNDFFAPSLRSLTLPVVRFNTLWAVMSCNGIPISQIECLYIISGSLIDHPKAYADTFRDLLSAATNLKTLKLDGTIASALVLKLLTDECRSLGQGRDLDLHLDQKEYTLKAGGAGVPFLEERLKEISSSGLCGSWEEAFKCIHNRMRNYS